MVECSDWDPATVRDLCLLSTDTMEYWRWFLDGRTTHHELPIGRRDTPILDSPYIALPVNTNSHWFLCIILNASQLVDMRSGRGKPSIIVLDSLANRPTKAIAQVKALLVNEAKEGQASFGQPRPPKPSDITVYYPSVSAPSLLVSS